jgi:hypothetical protein
VTLFAREPFPEDLWVRGVLLRTKSTRAVHHARIFLVPPTTAMPPDGKTFDDVTSGVGGLYTWFPGLVVESLPPGQAIRLPAGDRLVARTHFAPTRTPVSEQMEVGIYFAEGIVEKVPKELGI